jgi:hypothetical protein
MRSIALLTLLTWLLVGAVPPAYAQDDSDTDQSADAASLYQDGVRLFQEGKAAEALPLFEQAFSLTQSPNAQLMVGLCFKELGRLADAYRQLQQTVMDASARNEPKYEKTLETAQTELSALNERVGLLAIKLQEAPPGLKVELDGTALSDDQLAEPIAVQPGKHQVVASAEGRDTVTREVLIAAGHTKTLKLSLEVPAPPQEKPEPKPAPPPPPLQEKPKPKPATAPLRTVGYVVAGVGAASLAAFATTGLMAKGKYDKVHDACGGERCTDPKYADDIDSGKSLQTIANVTLVVGAVAVVAGSALIVFGGPGESEQPGVSAVVLPGGGYLGYAGRF